MSCSNKIFILGSFNVDITCYAERLPRHGETVFGSSVNMTAGGKGFNQAAAAAHSGANVRMLAKIGSDSLSAIAKSYFEKEKISPELVGISETAGTGCAFIEVDEQTGENRIVVASGANNEITAADVYALENEILESDLVLTQLETSLEAVYQLIALSKKHNKPMILNPAPSKSIDKSALDGLYLFTPNETEAEFYSGIPVTDEESAKRAAAAIRALGVRNVIITLGKKGAYYDTDAQRGISRAPSVKAVDTVGAGDAFNGALAARLLKGYSLQEAIKYANAFAALSVTKKGACDSMPLLVEAERFMDTF